MINEADIRNAYVFLRENNQDIPSEVLDFMLKASLEKLKEESLDKKGIINDVLSVHKTISYTLGMTEEVMNPDEAERQLFVAMNTLGELLQKIE